MRISTVVGGAIVFITGIGTGVHLAYKAAVKIDEKIYKGKLKEKFAEATTEVTTAFLYKKFESKRFEPKKFVYSRYDTKYERRSPKDVIFATRTDAEETRLKMNDYIEEYGQASVADLYDLVGDVAVYTDNKIGWKEGLSDELIVSTKDGWIIDFPDTCEL